MTTPLAPYAVVEAPKASAPAHSLLSVAVDVTRQSPPKWELGFRFYAETFIEASTWDPACGGRGQKSVPTQGPGEVTYEPYYVEAPFQCLDQGFEANDYVGRSTRGLDAAQAKAMENELWSGIRKPGNPSLKSVCGNGMADEFHGLLEGGAAVSVYRAMEALNKALAQCGPGSRGVIHAPVDIVTGWTNEFIVEEDGKGHLITRAKNNLVVAGGGYDGTGPAGATAPGAHQGYAFATTGPIHTRISENVEMVPEGGNWAAALDRATGLVTWRAEKVASAVWDTVGCFAVLIDLTLGEQ